MLDFVVLVGDCRERLAQLPDCSIDSVVTDPPYEIAFMSATWDAAGVAFDPAVWAEVLRVLKPGGHLLAFGGTRTYHRMTVAIEDAGFEIRDSLHWVYGSGFPKSLNVGKAIDKAAGAEREVVGSKVGQPGYSLAPNDTQERTAYGRFADAESECAITAPATDAAARWEGWGTALKPAHEPIVVARKPLTGTVAGNVLEYGTGALNIDGCRIGMSDTDREAARVPQGEWTTSGTTGATSQRSGEVFEPAPGGRWPANLVLTHHADCQHTDDTWECVQGCPAAEMDAQSGVTKDGVAVNRNGHDPDRQGYNKGWGTAPRPDQGYGGSGGASRYFTVTEWDPLLDTAPFRYVAKPAKKERNLGLDDKNHHPTVKPVTLMRWLVRLVTPPGGTVLDPFTGSGTTGMAAMLEGFDFVGVEQSDDYAENLARPRIETARRMAEGPQPAPPTATTASDPDPDQPSLFD